MMQLSEVTSDKINIYRICTYITEYVEVTILVPFLWYIYFKQMHYFHIHDVSPFFVGCVYSMSSQTFFGGKGKYDKTTVMPQTEIL